MELCRPRSRELCCRRRVMSPAFRHKDGANHNQSTRPLSWAIGGRVSRSSTRCVDNYDSKALILEESLRFCKREYLRAEI
jgi:hypothetical protein